MRWLITGATGFIGTTLAERLLGRGDLVRALVRDPAAARELRAMGADLVRGDVSRPETLVDSVPDVDAVVVFQVGDGGGGERVDREVAKAGDRADPGGDVATGQAADDGLVPQSV